ISWIFLFLKRNPSRIYLLYYLSLQSRTVEALLSPKSSKRPSAFELLESDLFLSQEQKIQRFQERVKEQDSEIKRLKNELQEKNRYIAYMQARFDENCPHLTPLSQYFIDQ
ncbi:hypothetical protein EGW08_020055, partial [Elysia chlorotica]